MQHVDYSHSAMWRQATCTQCDAGYYCTENSTHYDYQVCPVGHYCPAGTTSPYENPCPKGTYNPINGTDSEDDCLDCPPGQFCESK